MYRISLLIFILGLFSCRADYRGYVSSPATLSSPNFKIVKNRVSGEAKATYILGIGGLDQKGLYNSAIVDLQEKYPLKLNQSYIQHTVDDRLSMFLIVFTKTIRVTVDIVEFYEKGDAIPKEYENVIPQPIEIEVDSDFEKIEEIKNCNDCEIIKAGNRNLLYVDQIVCIKKEGDPNYGIVEFISNNLITIKFFHENGVSYSREIRIEEIYILKE